MKILKKNSAYIIQIEQSEKETGRTMYNTRHELAKLITHKERLQSNWNSLREWLEKQKHDTEICKEWNRKNNFNDIDYDRDIKRFDFILDKMNELEGKDTK